MRMDLVILLSAFLLSLALCAIEIPLLRRVGAGQNILSYVKEHQNKGGTPSMGGLAFVLAASVVCLVLRGGADKPFLVSLAVGGGYMLVGLIDDLMKKLRRENLGLKPYQKVFFQASVAILASVYCCLNGLTELKIPFTTLSIQLGWWFFPLGVLTLIATVNSVNLTDGLDGLAGSTSATFFLFFALIIGAQGGNGYLVSLSLALTGALGGYLVFNTNRASVFMGDTGSLALGGFCACIATFSGNILLIPLVGGMFVLSSISVIVQVIYYKKTGKRIFLMAPIHHHFQQKGHSEGKITYCYAAVTAVMGLLALLPLV